jgi:hypothetical protein
LNFFPGSSIGRVNFFEVKDGIAKQVYPNEINVYKPEPPVTKIINPKPYHPSQISYNNWYFTSKLYQQCGGIEWKGSKTCPYGSQCVSFVTIFLVIKILLDIL